MAAELLLAPEVQQDIDEAYCWYEYADGTVTVYGALHTSRDPEKWRQRLP